jgi:thioredoxin-related protein
MTSSNRHAFAAALVFCGEAWRRALDAYPARQRHARGELSAGLRLREQPRLPACSSAMPRSWSVLLVVVLSTAGCRKSPLAQPMRWDGELEPGIARAKAENKPLFLFFGAEWDKGTNEIVRGALVDPEVGALLRHDFVSVHVDLTDDDDLRTREVVRRFNVIGVPTMLVLDPDGSEIERINAWVTPERLLARLRATRHVFCRSRNPRSWSSSRCSTRVDAVLARKSHELGGPPAVFEVDGPVLPDTRRAPP